MNFAVFSSLARSCPSSCWPAADPNDGSTFSSSNLCMHPERSEMRALSALVTSFCFSTDHINTSRLLTNFACPCRNDGEISRAAASAMGALAASTLDMQSPGNLRDLKESSQSAAEQARIVQTSRRPHAKGVAEVGGRSAPKELHSATNTEIPLGKGRYG